MKSDKENRQRIAKMAQRQNIAGNIGNLICIISPIAICALYILWQVIF